MAGMDTLGSRLASARKTKGISQTAVAEACGWEGHTRISNYENGKEPENLDAIEKLAAAVGVSAAWLAFGEAPGVLLSAEERKLLIAFRKAAQHHREGVLMLLDPGGSITSSDPSGGSDEPITEDMFGSATPAHAKYEKNIIKAQAISRPGALSKKISRRP